MVYEYTWCVKSGKEFSPLDARTDPDWQKSLSIAAESSRVRHFEAKLLRIAGRDVQISVGLSSVFFVRRVMVPALN
jgi:hypothetical protein